MIVIISLIVMIILVLIKVYITLYMLVIKSFQASGTTCTVTTVDDKGSYWFMGDIYIYI